jgi:hypothetical protein
LIDGFTTEDLVFEWKEEDPVQVTRQLALHEFSLDSYQTNYCTSKTNTGMHSLQSPINYDNIIAFNAQNYNNFLILPIFA